MDKEQCLNLFERYVQGEATPSEIVELKTFLENDTHLSEWLEKQILVSSDKIDSDVEMRMLKNIRYRTDNYRTVFFDRHSKAKKQIPYFRWIANVAAVLLPVVLIFGAYLYLQPQKTESFEIIADMGEKASLTLSEGTKISVNSGSKVIYYNDYNKENRTVQLDGEAFFDVKHNPEKPFIVHCKDIKIQVLGTKFGIKAYENEENISVVLNSGRIRLVTPGEEIEMNPNDRIVYNKTTQKALRQKVNAEDYTDWRQNRLRFENESLETIMKTISRMHNIDIVFENSEIKKQRFTGTIDNTNIEGVLNTIRLTSSVNYKTKNGIIYLY